MHKNHVLFRASDEVELLLDFSNDRPSVVYNGIPSVKYGVIKLYFKRGEVRQQEAGATADPIYGLKAVVSSGRFVELRTELPVTCREDAEALSLNFVLKLRDVLQRRAWTASRRMSERERTLQRRAHHALPQRG